MEHEVVARTAACVRASTWPSGETVGRGPAARPAGRSGARRAGAPTPPPAIRADLAEVRERHAVGLDAARPAAVARRREHRPAHRAREHRRAGRPRHVRRVRRRCVRRPAAPPRARGADRAHAGRRPASAGRRRRAVGGAGAAAWSLSYDYTVLAGTQGMRTTQEATACSSWPSGAGCRSCCSPRAAAGARATPTAVRHRARLPAFPQFARLSGLVPVVGMVAGRCFAGNAALLGCCDVIIATADS